MNCVSWWGYYICNVSEEDRNIERKMKKNKISNPNNLKFSNNKIKSRSEEATPLHLIPAIMFTAIVILITRLWIYDNPLKTFWWNQQGDQLIDFFSYYKMWAILIIATISLCILAYKYFRKTLYLKFSVVYITMIIYSVCVSISYVFSEYKQFSLLGWEDRYEGTLVLLAYMVMLFYIINIVNNERDVKWMIYSVLVVCCLLGLLGLTQGIGHDLFATEFGRKMIIPSEYRQYLDNVSFKFKNNEIYQTVYNINYVSFYLTLIIPLVGMLFITSESKKSKVIYALIFTLQIYNILGASSSGGVLGIAVSILLAMVIFGKKLLNWKNEILILIIITAFVIVININTLAPELNSSIKSTLGLETTQQAHEMSYEKRIVTPGDNQKPSLEYIETNKDSVVMSLNGEIIKFYISRNTNNLKLYDGKNEQLVIRTLNVEKSGHMFAVVDNRFNFCTLDFAYDGTDKYLLVNIPEMTWAFLIDKDGMLYRTSYGSFTDLKKVKTFGFKGTEGFGSGRGYIWSRSLPLVKDTIIWGNGADTFAAYFPQDDFAGKYTGPSFSRNINTVIRKPHSMYLGTAINTGLVSLIALLWLFGLYILKSVKIYRKNNFNDFQSIAGVGIFLGICGFLVAGIVYDSNVCVMPLFYGLLGTGIAINYNMASI